MMMEISLISDAICLLERFVIWEPIIPPRIAVSPEIRAISNGFSNIELGFAGVSFFRVISVLFVLGGTKILVALVDCAKAI